MNGDMVACHLLHEGKTFCGAERTGADPDEWEVGCIDCTRMAGVILSVSESRNLRPSEALAWIESTRMGRP